MKSRPHARRKHVRQNEPIPWLPIDSRLFPFFSFGHVKGVMRIFLQIEIILAFSVVVGTVTVVVLRVMG